MPQNNLERYSNSFYMFSCEAIPEKLPNWVILITQVNINFYEIYYDPNTEDWKELCVEKDEQLQVLHNIGFKNPHFQVMEVS